MSGYGTYVGVELGQKDYFAAFEMALAPLFFLGGAIYSGWLVDRRIILGQEPRSAAGMIALAALNLFIYLGEFSGWLREFGEPWTSSAASSCSSSYVSPAASRMGSSPA